MLYDIQSFSCTYKCLSNRQLVKKKKQKKKKTDEKCILKFGTEELRMMHPFMLAYFKFNDNNNVENRINKVLLVQMLHAFKVVETIYMLLLAVK